MVLIAGEQARACDPLRPEKELRMVSTAIIQCEDH
jgi:hypothetical protein